MKKRKWTHPKIPGEPERRIEVKLRDAEGELRYHAVFHYLYNDMNLVSKEELLGSREDLPFWMQDEASGIEGNLPVDAERAGWTAEIEASGDTLYGVSL